MHRDKIVFHHGIVDSEEGGDAYHGETWAETAMDDNLGYVRWHSDGHTTFIDMIETRKAIPLLGVRLLKELRDRNQERIDPGMMNRDGDRLWRLYLARYRNGDGG